MIFGGIAAGASVIVDVAAKSVATFAVGELGRIGLNVAAGVIGNAGAGVLDELAGNSLNHLPLKTGLGGAALIGGVSGALVAFISEGIAYKYSNLTSAQPEEVEMGNLGSDNPEERQPLITQRATPARYELPKTIKVNFLVGLPEIIFTGFDALLVEGFQTAMLALFDFAAHTTTRRVSGNDYEGTC